MRIRDPIRAEVVNAAHRGAEVVVRGGRLGPGGLLTAPEREVRPVDRPDGARGGVRRDDVPEPADHFRGVPGPVREQVFVDRRPHRVLQVLELGGEERKHFAFAGIAIRFEVREHRGAGVLFPLEFRAVEHIHAGRADGVGVAVTGDGRVQGILERDSDEIAARSTHEAFTLRQLVQNPVVVMDVVFRAVAHNRFPVGSNALSYVGIGHGL